MTENVIETPIAESIKQFIEKVLLKNGERLNIEFLGKEPTQYAIEEIPCPTILNEYIDGSSERQYKFNFASREYFSQEVRQNIENCKFYENFARLLEECTKNDNLPELDGGRIATEIKAVSSGYVFSTAPNLDKAKYQIQCVLIYDQEAL